MPTPIEEELKAEQERLRAERVRRRKLNSRMSFPFHLRLPLAAGMAFVAGMGLGTSYGSQKVGLRFRAENAHRLPTTSTGWYLYHKSKNYRMAIGGLKEGIKMGAKLSFWTVGFFSVEEMFDRYRKTKDFVNTVIASLTVAGTFSLWSMQPNPFQYPLSLSSLLSSIIHTLPAHCLLTFHHRPVPDYHSCSHGKERIGYRFSLWSGTRCSGDCKGKETGLC